MTLEEALSGPTMQATYRYDDGGCILVDASWTFRNPHCKDEETYWVQFPYRIVRQAYHSLEEVKQAVLRSDADEWKPLSEEIAYGEDEA